PPGRTLSNPPTRSEPPPPPPRPQPSIEPPRAPLLRTLAPAPRLTPPDGSDGTATVARSEEAAVRAPLLRFEPGDLHAAADPLAPTARPVLPRPSSELDDPLLALEQEVMELERDNAPGPECARVFRTIARIWHERFGCIERAARAFREAASADPA